MLVRRHSDERRVGRVDRLGPRAEGHARPRRGRRGRHVEPVRQRRDGRRDLVLRAADGAGRRWICRSTAAAAARRHAFAAAGVPLASALQRRRARRLSGRRRLQARSARTARSARSTSSRQVDPAQRVRATELRAVVDVVGVRHRTSLRRFARRSARRCRTRNRDQRDVESRPHYGQVVDGGTLAIRGWDGRQIENQRVDARFRSPRRCATPKTRASNARIPSHDWGASALWTRGGVIGLESFSVGGDYRHYQGDFNESRLQHDVCPRRRRPAARSRARCRRAATRA